MTIDPKQEAVAGAAELRGLASIIRQSIMSHPAYSRATKMADVLEDHLCALAAREETQTELIRLRAEVERLTKARDEAEAAMVDARRVAQAAQGDALLWQFSVANGDVGSGLLLKVWGQRKEAERERDAAIAERDEARAQSGAKVKALEWEPYPNPVFAGPDVAVAGTSHECRYQVQRDPNAAGYMAYLAPDYGTLFWKETGLSSIEDAKAAAQADHERRVLAQLEPVPAPSAPKRKLEWHQTVFDFEGHWECGTYRIRRCADMIGASYLLEFAGRSMGHHLTLEAAKAAAQAHMEYSK